MDTPATAAKVAELETQLAETTARADATAQELADAQAQLAAAQTAAAMVPALEARVAELEHLLAPAAPDSGVLTVNYSDGRVKYAASDGSKYPLAADAEHRSKILALMKIGLGETQAEIMLQHGDAAIKALTA